MCYKCGKPGHFIAKCPISSESDRGDDKKGRRKEKKKYYEKKGGDAHVCREWDSDESFSDSSSDEDAANIAINKGLPPSTSREDREPCHEHFENRRIGKLLIYLL